MNDFVIILILLASCIATVGVIALCDRLLPRAHAHSGADDGRPLTAAQKGRS